jgi:hypothetical protein
LRRHEFLHRDHWPGSIDRGQCSPRTTASSLVSLLRTPLDNSCRNEEKLVESVIISGPLLSALGVNAQILRLARYWYHHQQNRMQN